MVSACGSPKTIENQETTDDNLSNLKTPLTYISKYLSVFTYSYIIFQARLKLEIL